jgi:hypothetical protein
MPTLLEPWPLLVTHSVLTFFMVGLIWFVQVVHYPLFAEVGRREFSRYEQSHVQRVGWVVGPVMLAEATTALALLTQWPASGLRPLAWVNVALLAVIWMSTVLWQVPRHAILRSGFEAETVRSLVATNWVRTFCWTARGALLGFLLATRTTLQ